MTKNRLILVGLVAAVIALIVGFIALSGDVEEPGPETITPPEESTTTNVSAPDESTTTAAVDDLSLFAPDAMPLPRQFESIQAGSHKTDSLSAPFSFTIEQSMFLQENRSGGIAISHVASRDPGDKGMDFMPLAVGFDRWLDILDGPLAGVIREDTTLGGFDVTSVSLDESSCGEGTSFCAEAGMTEAGLSRRFYAGSMVQVWVVDQGAEAPFAVIGSIWNEGDSVWFDVVEQVVSTLEFGDPSTG